MTSYRLLLLLVGAALVTGCGRHVRGWGEDQNQRLSLPPSDTVLLRRVAAAAASEPPQKELAYRLISASDTKCEDYMIGVAMGRSTFSTGLGIGGLTLSAIGAAVAPAGSANAFSAASALVQGAETEVNTNLFGGRDFQVIYQAVQVGRARERRALVDFVERGGVNGWSAESVLELVNAYHVRCGVNFGLAEITAAVGGQASTRQDVSLPAQIVTQHRPQPPGSPDPARPPAGALRQ